MKGNSDMTVNSVQTSYLKITVEERAKTGHGQRMLANRGSDCETLFIKPLKLTAEDTAINDLTQSTYP